MNSLFRNVTSASAPQHSGISPVLTVMKRRDWSCTWDWRLSAVCSPAHKPAQKKRRPYRFQHSPRFEWSACGLVSRAHIDRTRISPVQQPRCAAHFSAFALLQLTIGLSPLTFCCETRLPLTATAQEMVWSSGSFSSPWTFTVTSFFAALPVIFCV